MKWDVDTPVRVGDYAFAAIVEVRVSIHSTGRSMLAEGEKRPLMFVLLNHGKARGIDLKGQTYEAEEIDLLWPHAIERMTALLRVAPRK